LRKEDWLISTIPREISQLGKALVFASLAGRHPEDLLPGRNSAASK